MGGNKEVAKQVLEELLTDNSKPCYAESFKKIGSLCTKLRIFYSDSFVSQAKGYSKRYLQEFSKFHRCATSYGYVGVSTGKKNGIVDIRGTNTQLLHSYKTLLTDDVIKKYGLKRESLKPVKVVAHVENGNRMIGALDYTEKEGALTVVMLGISNYNGKPR